MISTKQREIIKAVTMRGLVTINTHNPLSAWQTGVTALLVYIYADEAGHESKLIYMYQFISRNQQPFNIHICYVAF